jgi:type IV secretion system protein TrbF
MDSPKSEKPVGTPYKPGPDSMLDNWLHGSTIEAKLWRRACLVISFITCLAIIGLIIQSKRDPTVYVVEVTEHGSVKITGKAEMLDYHAQSAVLNYFLSDFVKNIRGVPTDAMVLKENLFTAYQFLTSNGKIILNAHFKEHDPFTKIKQNTTVTVSISNIIKRTESSYQVTWVEELLRNGVRAERERYSGLFTIIIQKPKTEDIIKVNPLGIWIDFLNFSKEQI